MEKERIVQASAGRYHTTALSASGRVYTFGLNDRGQLGRAGVAGDPGATRPCVCDSGGSCGCAPPADDDAAAADTPESSSREGARCFGGPTCRDGTARAVDFGAAHAGKRATFTASGRYATAATLDTGEVLAWGLVLCGAGKDALADPAKAAARLLANPLEAATPRSVVAPGGDGLPDDGTNLFLSDRAVAVDIGYVHVVILTESGRVFTCDTGFDGYAGGLSDAFAPNGQHQLGRVAASPAAALAPGLVEFPFPKSSVVKATEPTSGDAGEDAPRSKDDDDEKVDEDENRIVAVAAGRCHGAAVDAGGRAYFFGCGALGGATAGGGENDEGLPRLVDDAILRGRAVVDVAAGEHFTLASAADGGMVGWGDGNSGQLGLDADALARERRATVGGDGRNADAPGPAGGAVEVPMGEGARVIAPVAGYQHALAIVAKEAPRRR